MHVLLVGCGNMGQSLLAGWLARLSPRTRIDVYDPKPPALPENPRHLEINVVSDPGAVKAPDIIVLAVKPQQFVSASSTLRNIIGKKTLAVSIMAGISITSVGAALNTRRVVRAMPNLAARIGYGFTGLAAASALTQTDRQRTEKIFAATGLVSWIEESLMDGVTAATGSGPAFFYYMLECYQKSVEALGFSPEQAKIMTLQTYLGAGHLAQESSEEFSMLRHYVTSPGGTTEAGLKILMQSNFESVLKETLLRARERGRELAQIKPD